MLGIRSQTHVTFQRVATRLVPCCGNILRILQCNSSGRVSPNEQYISHLLENKKKLSTLLKTMSRTVRDFVTSFFFWKVWPNGVQRVVYITWQYATLKYRLRVFHEVRAKVLTRKMPYIKQVVKKWSRDGFFLIRETLSCHWPFHTGVQVSLNHNSAENELKTDSKITLFGIMERHLSNITSSVYVLTGKSYHGWYLVFFLCTKFKTLYYYSVISLLCYYLILGNGSSVFLCFPRISCVQYVFFFSDSFEKSVRTLAFKALFTIPDTRCKLRWKQNIIVNK